MNGRERIVECRRCGRSRPNAGRGLCTPCHKACRRDGTLADYRRVTWSNADLTETAAIIRARHSYRWSEVAATIGVRPATLDRARQRARLRNV